MKLDLNLLNRIGKQNLDCDIVIADENFKDTDIIRTSNIHFNGLASINVLDELELTGNLKGVMTIPCSVTLEEVNYEFDTDIEENLGNFAEILKNNKNVLDIISVICENIVLEIPMRVVKEGVDAQYIKGEGWEFSEEE